MNKEVWRDVRRYLRHRERFLTAMLSDSPAAAFKISEVRNLQHAMTRARYRRRRVTLPPRG